MLDLRLIVPTDRVAVVAHPAPAPLMALILTVDQQRWRAHVRETMAALPGLVPVVKGNGYGFGRTYLLDALATWASDPRLTPRIDEVAVGTVHELAGLDPAGPTPLVLTPALARELAPGIGPAVLTVGSRPHIAELRRAALRAPVMVKLASPMGRYGVAPGDLADVLTAIGSAGLPVHGFGLHLPLAGTSAERVEATIVWTSRLPAGATVYVSHLDVAALGVVRAAAPGLRWRLRTGTALWHGDKTALRLEADVVDVRAVGDGAVAGYRLGPVPGPGHLVMVTAGTADGVRPLTGPAGEPLSPFHHARRRLALLEPPHMHTSMLFVPEGDPCPAVGDRVDVQQPLTTTLVDRIVER